MPCQWRRRACRLPYWNFLLANLIWMNIIHWNHSFWVRKKISFIYNQFYHLAIPLLTHLQNQQSWPSVMSIIYLANCDSDVINIHLNAFIVAKTNKRQTASHSLWAGSNSMVGNMKTLKPTTVTCHSEMPMDKLASLIWNQTADFYLCRCFVQIWLYYVFSWRRRSRSRQIKRRKRRRRKEGKTKEGKKKMKERNVWRKMHKML